MPAQTLTAGAATVNEQPPRTAPALDAYRLLGRSGLRISPLALGTMTFGSDWGWGAEREEAKKMFDHYLDRGGNFIDTANNYTNGRAEQLVGEFAQQRRDQLVIATKYALSTRHGDPNAGGNHRKSMIRSVEGSLRRLQTDYIDLLYLHVWDGTTPAEEILRGLDDLVRAGKVLYVGISDTPAWQVSRMQAIADLRGWSPLIALQIPYSLIERTVERELTPMAAELGLGVIPWSPLGFGVLTGKYTHADLDPEAPADAEGTRRRQVVATGRLTERTLKIAEAVREVADELGTTAPRVAIAWTLANPAVAAPIVGARTLSQLEDNLGACRSSSRQTISPNWTRSAPSNSASQARSSQTPCSSSTPARRQLEDDPVPSSFHGSSVRTRRPLGLTGEGAAVASPERRLPVRTSGDQTALLAEHQRAPAVRNAPISSGPSYSWWAGGIRLGRRPPPRRRGS
jgi:aryl-alcohol dehydrogenase-like predicted oxidoreductase